MCALQSLSCVAELSLLLVVECANDALNLHLAIADAAGNTIGGHLLRGCRVYTTAEIVIAESTELEFTRTNDGTTPWKELQIRHRARAAAASPQ